MPTDDPKNQHDAEDNTRPPKNALEGRISAAIDRAWLRERLARLQDPPVRDDTADAADAENTPHDLQDAGHIPAQAASDEPVADESETAPQDNSALQVLLAQDTARVDDIAESKSLAARVDTPWTLQQFFNGQIDLDIELTRRFPNMPMMASAKFRTLGDQPHRRVATLQAQDDSASLIIDADTRTKIIQMSFTFGSMLTLRFVFGNLNSDLRKRWMEIMQREQGGPSFLWGPDRWQEDYLVCISRKYFTNLYAFSPHNFEAGVRLTPAVMDEVLEWLKEVWLADDREDDTPPPLLTW